MNAQERAERNALIIAFAAIAGIKVWRTIFERFPIPDLEDFVMWGDPMRCEYMVDAKVQFSPVQYSAGNPLRKVSVQLSRFQFEADELLDLNFRSWGDFERFTKHLHAELWRIKEGFIESGKRRPRASKRR